MFLRPEFELLGHIIYPKGNILISAKAVLIWNRHNHLLSFQVNYGS